MMIRLIQLHSRYLIDLVKKSVLRCKRYSYLVFYISDLFFLVCTIHLSSFSLLKDKENIKRDSARYSAKKTSLR